MKFIIMYFLLGTEPFAAEKDMLSALTGAWVLDGANVLLLNKYSI